MQPANTEPHSGAPSCSVIWFDSAMKVALFIASLVTVLRMVTISLAMICRQHSRGRLGREAEGAAALQLTAALPCGASTTCARVGRRQAAAPLLTLADTRSLRLAASLTSFSAFFCSRCTSADRQPGQ